jgi:hypothetical protein
MYTAFLDWLEPTEHFNWNKIKFGKEMPTTVIKGRRMQDGQWCFGNISLEQIESTKPKLELLKGLLR